MVVNRKPGNKEENPSILHSFIPSFIHPSLHHGHAERMGGCSSLCGCVLLWFVSSGDTPAQEGTSWTQSSLCPPRSSSPRKTRYEYQHQYHPTSTTTRKEKVLPSFLSHVRSPLHLLPFPSFYFFMSYPITFLSLCLCCLLLLFSSPLVASRLSLQTAF